MTEIVEVENVPAEEPQMEDYLYVFTPEDLKTMISAALESKASLWEQQASEESLKGAANQGMMGTLRWGARQYRDLARVVRSLPEGETRLREVEPVLPATEDNRPVDPEEAPPILYPMPNPWPDSQMDVVSIPVLFPETMTVFEGNTTLVERLNEDSSLNFPPAGETVAVDTASGGVTETTPAPVPQDTTRKPRGKNKGN